MIVAVSVRRHTEEVALPSLLLPTVNATKFTIQQILPDIDFIDVCLTALAALAFNSDCVEPRLDLIFAKFRAAKQLPLVFATKVVWLT